MQIFIETGEIPAHPEATALFQDAITLYDTHFLVINVSETFFNRNVNKDVAVVLRSFTKIQELKLAMNLIYDKNRSPSSEEYRKGILTCISNDTHTARRRVEGVRNQMNVAWNTPEAVMMRNLRTRLADLNRTSSK